ncbi:hypothetical protein K435DRAFT_799840 [Dendrothele bispora CBS 962.96]|uniref:Uncharacterized protein n=1 Tax=Dendrothele bispora (strain CBS 962.96) TaxID=1314807 RepID=A0A4V4HF20_DENBC|nr:hypothetical protein K435DRAFT_799840 [Dendrothele bispora CBS 962.96]
MVTTNRYWKDFGSDKLSREVRYWRAMVKTRGGETKRGIATTIYSQSNKLLSMFCPTKRGSSSIKNDESAELSCEIECKWKTYVDSCYHSYWDSSVIGGRKGPGAERAGNGGSL